MGVTIEHLNELYAHTTDPWNFRTSSYEHAKFSHTMTALARRHYAAVLELGCGNGILAKMLSQVTDRYIGIDAVQTAIDAARLEVPPGEFHCRFLPCELPHGPVDLIVLSEILYFLDRQGIVRLADQIMSVAPQAEILSVNFRGATGNLLQGDEAAELFAAAIRAAYSSQRVRTTRSYRIDRYEPSTQAGELD